MAVPDRIEREIALAHPPERVWDALTTAEGLGTWFGTSARIDLRPGGQAQVTWTEDDQATLEPVATGTKLRVTEFGFAQLPEDTAHSAYESNRQGWHSELAELATYLDDTA